MANEQYAGPLNFAVFAFPAGADLTDVTGEIQHLSASRAVEILDVELIAVGVDGRPSRTKFVGAAEALAGAETDLLTAEDLEFVTEQMTVGEEALVVVYEDRSLARLAELSARVGGREELIGGVDPSDLIELIGDEA